MIRYRDNEEGEVRYDFRALNLMGGENDSIVSRKKDKKMGRVAYGQKIKGWF